MSHAIRRPRPHAVWTTPLPTEAGAPDWRTVHVVTVGLARREGPVRIGVRPSRGYLHCGSRDEIDQVRDVRVHAWDGAAWRVAHETHDLPLVPDAPLTGGPVHWLDGDWTGARALRVELRRSWVDDWWPSWNLADLGVVVDGARPAPFLDERDSWLTIGEVRTGSLPDGLAATIRPEEVVFRSLVLEVGFRLASPTLSWLAFDPDGLPDRTTDLLHHAVLFTHTGNDLVVDSQQPLRGVYANGPRYTDVDGIEHLGSHVRAMEGRSSVDGPTVRYQVRLPDPGLEYELTWTVGPDSLRLDVARSSTRPLMGAESSAWQIPFDASAAITGLMARPDRRGETGLATGPAMVHAPGWGNLEVATSGDVLLRADAYRPLLGTTLEMKVGEEPGPIGEWVLPAGRREGSVELRVRSAEIPPLRADTPEVVRSAIRRTAPSGLSFRLDTATLSNNHASIHATFCMDHWAYLAVAVGDVLPGLSSIGLVTDSMDRHLRDGPGYGAGHTSGGTGRIEDEYLHTEVALLLAAGVIAQRPEGIEWVRSRADGLARILERVHERDVDGDGLIEGEVRRGISGSRAWATNWWDIISFGWKDAWLNAELYDALVRIARDAPEVARASSLGAEGVQRWGEALRAAYVPAFWNEATGWLAGWRSSDDVLHDHGYLFVSGAAVNAGLLEPDVARAVVDRLWEAIPAAGFAQFQLGLPGNILPIPDADLAGALPDLHHGFYENGAATLSQTRHFIGALQRVGRGDDADRLLVAMLGRLADGTSFGGCSSGVDWRMWDGTRCGYEGLLTDQFGVLVPALARWGAA
jgi:hypothetical protein